MARSKPHGRSQLRPAASIMLASLLVGACMAQETPKPTTPPPGLCTEPRPQMCMEIYLPVCGFTKDGIARTYPNSCQACAHAEVARYEAGQCRKDSNVP